MSGHGNRGNKNAAHKITPNVNLNIRCSDKHRERWRRAARRNGMSLSQWVVKTLNREAKR